jgi:hypothetical protein
MIVVSALFAASPALAEKPEWAGKGKGHDKSEWRGKGKGHNRGGDEARDHRGRHFGEEQRVVVHEYYGERFRLGHCPPGLAKKNNGCMPPGQAKKWRVGKPLPHDVIYYEPPRDLVVRLGAPPPGHRYVRVAADILLITVGSAMVVDAIQDLGRV